MKRRQRHEKKIFGVFCSYLSPTLCSFQKKIYSGKCWNIPSKYYFPQIVWFTVNEFSLPIIIWRSFRSRPRHRGHCCRKHERKYLEISASSLSAPLWGDLDIPRPVNGGNYQLIKETSNYETHCFFRIFGGKNLTVKLWFFQTCYSTIPEWWTNIILKGEVRGGGL